MSASEKKDSAEQAEFRQYCRSWLKDNMPPAPPVRIPLNPIEVMTIEQLDYLSAWQKSAYEAGLVGCDYPESYGGGGRTNCQRIANQEMQSAGTPFFPNVIGLGMAAPTIYYHSQEHVKEALLPKLLSGEEIWCQGFSEPGAGSDLANVQTFAEKKGDKWVINGHKVWTSCAHFATWMIILCRTSKTDRYKGLSYFVVPIKAALGKGVTVRPLIKMTGETGFNEVIFEDLEIDDGYRCDEVGNGWAVAMTTLLHERGGGELVTPAAGGAIKGNESGKAKFSSSAKGLIELAKSTMRNGKPASEDPVLRDKIIREAIIQEGFKQVNRRSLVRGLTDHPMRLQLQYKLMISKFLQDSAHLAVEIQGATGTLYLGDENAPVDGEAPLAYANSFGFTIAAGSNEVQHNILGERVLGLAKSK